MDSARRGALLHVNPDDVRVSEESDLRPINYRLLKNTEVPLQCQTGFDREAFKNDVRGIGCVGFWTDGSSEGRENCITLYTVNN